MGFLQRSSAAALLLVALICIQSGESRNNHKKAVRPQKSLHLEYAWKKIDYLYPSKAAHEKAVKSGEYNGTNLVPIDVDVWEKGGKRKVFVTVITFRGGATNVGMPATLNTVSHRASADGSRAPLLQPYPNWSWHNKSSCDSLHTVYRVDIDELDRLWVMDMGLPQGNCPPRLLAFDLHTDKLLVKVELDKNFGNVTSGVITPVVDVRPTPCGGHNTFVYIADLQGRIVVYDLQTNSTWRAPHSTFKLSLSEGLFNMSGMPLFLPDGVVGVALSPLRCDKKGNCEDRTLFYQAMASLHLGHVQTSVLRNRTNFEAGVNRAESAFQFYEEQKRFQSAPLTMSKEGVLFFGNLPDYSLGCWNPRNKYTRSNVETLVKDDVAMQFNTGIKVRGGKVYAMFSRFHLYLFNMLNFTEVNFRVFSGKVSELIKGTKCA